MARFSRATWRFPKRGPAMPRKKQDEEEYEYEYVDEDEELEPATIGRVISWIVVAGLWLLLVAALASYSPADPPGHSVAPLNHTPANWAGGVGAGIAHHVYLMIGPGIWIGVIGVAAWLVAAARRKPVTQIGLRLTGLILMSVTASTLVATGVIGIEQIGVAITGPRPEGAGGLLAIFLSDELVLRFNVLGTSVIMLILFVIGGVLAADQLVLAMSRVLGRSIKSMGGFVLPRLARIPPPWEVSSALVGAAGQLRGKWQYEEEEDGVLRPRPRTRNRREDDDEEEDEDHIDENLGGLGGVHSFDPDEKKKSKKKSKRKGSRKSAKVVEEDIDEEVELDEVEEDEGAIAVADAPGAYIAEKNDDKAFTPDELREKIKQLPINLAPRALKKGKVEPPREMDLSGYKFPEMDLLVDPEGSFTEEQEQMVRDQAMALEAALGQYRIEGEVVGIDSGPVITLFEVRLAPGTKVNRLNTVASDLARALKAHNIRIVPNTAGKDTVGVEVPNLKKEKVRLKELMTIRPGATKKMHLPMFLGKDASGNPLIADLAAMPHMLIAGTTGSGKSVCMNSIIMSFLYTKKPDELKLVLVDPKMVEMSMFKDIPHLMCPVVTEMPKASAILEWAVTKMDERYELLAEAGVRNIAAYNSLDYDELLVRMNPSNEEEEAKIPKKIPYMVFIVDELADLMMTNKEVEHFIVRIAQKARAVGIHLILATQRPQANVVTGLIKGNMPCRVSFKVASRLDSRIVLDQAGAELLLGHGDMLYLSPRTSKLSRSQGTLVDDLEIRKVVRYLKDIAQQSFEPQLIQLKQAGAISDDDEAERDPLFEDAVRVVLESQRGSVSLLQRRLTIGYSRSSRLIEQIAQAGIIGEYKGSQAREVHYSLEEWEAIKAQVEADAAAGVDVQVEDVEENEIEETEASNAVEEVEKETDEDVEEVDQTQVVEEEEEVEEEDEYEECDEDEYEEEEEDEEAEEEDDGEVVAEGDEEWDDEWEEEEEDDE